ncbi:MAG: flagellar filament outer layer protein FlaA [Spirochaetaceae bacterium]|jgi:hypothetical protein|nr:flagellar filament outer layer protein FlaA [Spirochaetaceae bacterium]
MMKYNKIILMALFLLMGTLVIGPAVFAQDAPAPAAGGQAAPAAGAQDPATIGGTDEIGYSEAANIGAGTAQLNLKEVSVDKFEQEGFWSASMSTEEGYTRARLFQGGPAEKKPLDGQTQDDSDSYILGIRTDFLKRGINSIFIIADRPIPVSGIVKDITVWVAGRGFNHKLILLVKDNFGKNYELSMNPNYMNFQGWKQMVAQVPPQSEYDNTGVLQRNNHFPSDDGLQIVGFRIDCDPKDAYGTYYVYFDDMRATVDLNEDEVKAADDPTDNW